MKSTLIQVIVSGFLLIGSSSILKAEILESNITFQMKVYTQLPSAVNGDRATQNYEITTYKTGDIAQKLAALQGVSVSKNARILHRIRYRDNFTSQSYVVRDKNNPTDIPVDFSNILISSNNLVRSLRGSVSKTNTATTTLSNGGFRVILAGNEEFTINGSMTTKERLRASKDSPFTPLSLLSRSLNGHGTYTAPSGNGGFNEKYSTAIIKVSVPKILPLPPPD